MTFTDDGTFTPIFTKSDSSADDADEADGIVNGDSKDVGSHQGDCQSTASKEEADAPSAEGTGPTC